MSADEEVEEIRTAIATDAAAATERELWSKRANRQQGVRAVGGRATITTRRLLFASHALDSALGGADVAIELADIETVEAKGLRRLVHITTRSGETERLVLQPPKRSAQLIEAAAEAARTGARIEP